MEILDYQLDSMIFKEPIVLFYTARDIPLSRVVNNMEELIELKEEIKRNNCHSGVGALSIDFQLWFALALRTKLFEEQPKV